MKICCNCKIKKLNSEFYKGKKSGKLLNPCKKCQIKRAKLFLKNNPDKKRKHFKTWILKPGNKEKHKMGIRRWYSKPKNKKRANISNLERTQKKKDFFYNYKKFHSCAKCSENDPCALDFHHLDPKKKEFLITSFYGGLSVAWPRVEKEMKKCIILCSNCHRKEHYYSRVKKK